ncbi:hypothetical protein [Kordiimonas marina]|uniref:hypothetical protein n=1 Tax=Kordiimonas marina TaxID=2872312 RepID=UPI001FF61220|nr:hypothetical protein [Kordiimonas marina]MCJ9430509.1 hypothetical protein [Kordiimonas marina]
MTETKKNTAPQKNADEKLKSDDKQARLAEALRANLRRRKAQARDRRDTGSK